MLGCYLFNIGVDSLEESFNEDGSMPTTEVHEETLVRTDDFPAVSTPKRVGPSQMLAKSPIPGRNQDFAILPRVANVPHWVKNT